MGLISLVVGYQQKLDFSPLFHRLLGAVDLFKSVDDCVKGCHVRGLPVGSVHRAYVDWRGKHTYRVGRVFPYRVYIDSNHRDFRI
jgi:hypothetical protein